jgi:predicted ATP-dependent endonuclease of OLD family
MLTLMQIRRLQIENFRSIEKVDLTLPQVCALVGPNNAGKSNILSALRRVLMPEYGPRTSHFTEEDVYLRDAARDIQICVTFDAPLPYSKLKNADPAYVSSLKFDFTRVKKGDRKGERRLDQICLTEEGDTPSVQATWGRTGQQPRFEPIVGVPQELRERIPFVHIGTDRSMQDQLPSARFSILRRIFEDIDRDLQRADNFISVRRPDGTSSEVPRLARFERLIDAAMKTLRTAEFEALEASIKSNALEQLGLDPRTDGLDLYFTPMNTLDFYKSLDFVVREGDVAISATEMGGGMQNALVMAVLRAFEQTRKKGAIILIEEPEMFLHPQMQRSLYATIQSIGQTNQVIYSTHSANFVTIPDYENVRLVRRSRSTGTGVTASSLPNSDWRKAKLRQAMDAERGELFFAKKLLVVEGATEKLALPEFAAKLRIDLDTAGVTVVEVGGKKNLLDVAELAVSFGIPTGVIFDTDAKDFSSEQEQAEYNDKLLRLANATTCVWPLDPDYERYLRSVVGEETYLKVLARYPPSEFGQSKSRRGRLIAADPDMTVPPVLAEALRWAAERPLSQKSSGEVPDEDQEWLAAAPNEPA